MKWKQMTFIKKLTDLLFLFILCLIVLCFYSYLIINGQKDESILENKSLQKIPTFHLNTFIDGTYQTALENSIVDQMPYSEEIKGYLTKTKASTINQWQTNLLTLFHTQEKEEASTEETNTQEESVEEVRNIKYIPISNNVYHYGDSEYMVFKYRQLDKYKSDIDEMARVYNKAFENIESYFYFVNQSKSINFNTVSEKENDFLTYIKQVFHFNGITGLKISSYEQYMDYFYETDHHWNYKGSYQAYVDIIHMMLPHDKVLTPIATKTFDVYYYGSNARTTSIYTNKEKFTVYQFDVPEFETQINGQYATYGNEKNYFNGKYSTTEGYNHYRAFYGGDFAEVVYDFHQPEKENLLIIAPSYSNANNKLIASHFNKTYVIDLRHYENEFGKPFDPQQYCQDNNIDKFLLMISVDHLTNGNFMLEVE